MTRKQNSGGAKIAALWFGVSIYFNSALVLLATPLFTRLMSPAQYGEITLYNSLSVVIGAFATLSLYAGVFNSAMLKFEGGLNQLMASMFVLVTLCSVVVWLAIFLAFEIFGNFTGVREELLLFMALQILTAAVFSFWTAHERFRLSYKTVTAISVTSSVLGVGGAALTMTLGAFPQHNVEVRIILAALPQVIVGLIIYARYVKSWRAAESAVYWPYALSMGMPLIPHYLAQNFLQQYDKFAVERFVGKDGLGVYGLALAVASGLTLFWTAINTTWIPWMLRQYRDGDLSPIKEAVPTILNVVAGLVIVGCMLSPDVVSMIAPLEYHGAASIIPLMLVASFVQFVHSIYLTLQFHEGKSWAITAVSLASAALSVTLNNLLAPSYGISAVAGVLIFSQIAQLCLQYCASSGDVRSVIQVKKALTLIIGCNIFALAQVQNGTRNGMLRYLIAGAVTIVIVSYGIQKLKGTKSA